MGTCGHATAVHQAHSIRGNSPFHVSCSAFGSGPASDRSLPLRFDQAVDWAGRPGQERKQGESHETGRIGGSTRAPLCVGSRSSRCADDERCHHRQRVGHMGRSIVYIGPDGGGSVSLAATNFARGGGCRPRFTRERHLPLPPLRACRESGTNGQHLSSTTTRAPTRTRNRRSAPIASWSWRTD